MDESIKSGGCRARATLACAGADCSAWDDAETRRRTADLGFSMHLRKPVCFEVLEAALRELSPVTAVHGRP